MPVIWIESGKQREDVAWALISNGYEVKQIERPNKDWPESSKDYGLEYKEKHEKE